MLKESMKDFYKTDSDDLEFAPFDIETTGFKAAEGDFITTFILHNNSFYHIWLNTDGDKIEASEVRDSIVEASGFDNIVLYVSESQSQLLEEVEDYVSTHTGDKTILTAFNGETYRGTTDFDIPFLRTSCFRSGVSWIFSGLSYSDIYEVFSQSSRFDTTVKAEPSLDSMKKSDIQTFVDDEDLEVRYDSMNKKELADQICRHDNVNAEILDSWLESNVEEYSESEDSPENETAKEVINRVSPNKPKLESFVDSKNYDISYDNLKKSELVSKIRSSKEYDVQMLEEWHKKTGRSIGTTEATTLDSIHRSIVEDKIEDDEWLRNLPFDLYQFEPFDPFDDSGEAVTSYIKGEYTDVILHCLADVARTVNLNRIMVEYAPKKSYSPKSL